MYKKYYGGFIPDLKIYDENLEYITNRDTILRQHIDIYNNDQYNYIEDGVSRESVYIPPKELRRSILRSIQSKIEEKRTEYTGSISNLETKILEFRQSEQINDIVNDTIKLILSDFDKKTDKNIEKIIAGFKATQTTESPEINEVQANIHEGNKKLKNIYTSEEERVIIEKNISELKKLLGKLKSTQNSSDNTSKLIDFIRDNIKLKKQQNILINFKKTVEPILSDITNNTLSEKIINFKIDEKNIYQKEIYNHVIDMNNGFLNKYQEIYQILFPIHSFEKIIPDENYLIACLYNNQIYEIVKQNDEYNIIVFINYDNFYNIEIHKKDTIDVDQPFIINTQVYPIFYKPNLINQIIVYGLFIYIDNLFLTKFLKIIKHYEDHTIFSNWIKKFGKFDAGNIVFYPYKSVSNLYILLLSMGFYPYLELLNINYTENFNDITIDINFFINIKKYIIDNIDVSEELINSYISNNTTYNKILIEILKNIITKLNDKKKSIINIYNLYKMKDNFNKFKYNYDTLNNTRNNESFNNSLNDLNIQIKLNENQCWYMFLIDLLEEIYYFKKLTNNNKDRQFELSTIISSLYFTLLYSNEMRTIVNPKCLFDNFPSDTPDKIKYIELNTKYDNNQIKQIQNMYKDLLRPSFKIYIYNNVSPFDFINPVDKHAVKRPMCCEINMYNFINYLLYDTHTHAINLDYFPLSTITNKPNILQFYEKNQDINKFEQSNETQQEFYKLFTNFELQIIPNYDIMPHVGINLNYTTAEGNGNVAYKYWSSKQILDLNKFTNGHEIRTSYFNFCRFLSCILQLEGELSLESIETNAIVQLNNGESIDNDPKGTLLKNIMMKFTNPNIHTLVSNLEIQNNDSYVEVKINEVTMHLGAGHSFMEIKNNNAVTSLVALRQLKFINKSVKNKDIISKVFHSMFMKQHLYASFTFDEKEDELIKYFTYEDILFSFPMQIIQQLIFNKYTRLLKIIVEKSLMRFSSFKQIMMFCFEENIDNIQEKQEKQEIINIILLKITDIINTNRQIKDIGHNLLNELIKFNSNIAITYIIENNIKNNKINLNLFNTPKELHTILNYIGARKDDLIIILKNSIIQYIINNLDYLKKIYKLDLADCITHVYNHDHDHEDIFNNINIITESTQNYEEIYRGYVSERLEKFINTAPTIVEFVDYLSPELKMTLFKNIINLLSQYFGPSSINKHYKYDTKVILSIINLLLLLINSDDNYKIFLVNSKLNYCFINEKNTSKFLELNVKKNYYCILYFYYLFNEIINTHSYSLPHSENIIAMHKFLIYIPPIFEDTDLNESVHKLYEATYNSVKDVITNKCYLICDNITHRHDHDIINREKSDINNSVRLNPDYLLEIVESKKLVILDLILYYYYGSDQLTDFITTNIMLKNKNKELIHKEIFIEHNIRLIIIKYLYSIPTVEIIDKEIIDKKIYNNLIKVLNIFIEKSSLTPIYIFNIIEIIHHQCNYYITSTISDKKFNFILRIYKDILKLVYIKTSQYYNDSDIYIKSRRQKCNSQIRQMINQPNILQTNLDDNTNLKEILNMVNNTNAKSSKKQTIAKSSPKQTKPNTVPDIQLKYLKYKNKYLILKKKLKI